jgi:hypothetical protein
VNQLDKAWSELDADEVFIVLRAVNRSARSTFIATSRLRQKLRGASQTLPSVEQSIRALNRHWPGFCRKLRAAHSQISSQRPKGKEDGAHLRAQERALALLNSKCAEASKAATVLLAALTEIQRELVSIQGRWGSDDIGPIRSRILSTRDEFEVLVAKADAFEVPLAGVLDLVASTRQDWLFQTRQGPKTVLQLLKAGTLEKTIIQARKDIRRGRVTARKPGSKRLGG